MFFRKTKKCPECGNKLSPEWSFCPSCGRSLKEREILTFPGFASFDDMFKQMERQIAEIDKLFAQPIRMPRIVMRPGGSGFSITITSGTGQKPQISVKTFGEAKKFEPQIKQQLGVDKIAQEVEAKPKVARPSVTEEPEMEVKKEGTKLIYSIKLPGVDAKNIHIKRLPNSIEIRAISGKKLYFKLFEAPPNLTITDKKFSDSVLTITLAQTA
ncbi:MAG: zinc ribbon domain-containing protein [Candidatus Aenigmatarchaeota archaeon]